MKKLIMMAVLSGMVLECFGCFPGQCGRLYTLENQEGYPYILVHSCTGSFRGTFNDAVHSGESSFVKELLATGVRDYNFEAYNFAIELGYTEIAQMIKESEEQHTLKDGPKGISDPNNLDTCDCQEHYLQHDNQQEPFIVVKSSGMVLSCFGCYFALHQKSVLSPNNESLEKEPQGISNPNNFGNIGHTDQIGKSNCQQEHYLRYDNQKEPFITVKSTCTGELLLKEWVIYFNLLDAVQLHRINFVKELLAAGAQDHNQEAYNYAKKNGYIQIAQLLKEFQAQHQTIEQK